ncbi:acyltransferase family protein [Pseudomonas sp. CCI3.2]|uniref:acyltransferase family protein n=1 Tax=unclassified Pseudomonas TaxID=196821 RepID=UPI002AC98C81|nr:MULTISPECIES: acyltransferase family protein [unclassified Pseudomonas]MEB0077434.1 acyltransferase family protein [Pseudomonas sp. MH10out]MEB0101111.1 acyltransferase family protein [Pseudomonas sp. CCI3.2]MEB0130037.1 acyltransferase family protein [Pseudomonas sp. CCI2.4]MEB0157211.1 acyltransferase family protein [Pseudomonas sp. AH2 (2023)]MEB0168459.1 acyltransferase family protein [Pseudomonas sp. CCC4.4]
MNYILGNRRDIDGLRALAVIPVVLFHYGFNGFSGGFVGVDVFFVISGFLITSIICREIEAGRFSFYEFWSRRARRIIPALSLVMGATLLVGWLLLPPNDYAQLGRTVRYQAMFASNILFMRQDGYFDAASAFKPLLHTWSLAVEEQYYIFFPLLMVLLTRYLRRWRWALFALLVGSFLLNVWTVNRQPDAAFFLLPMRAWELLCGAMLAVLPVSQRSLRPWVYQAVSAAGLAAVMLAVSWLDKNTLFPGWAALLPVVGATAMIWANGQSPTWVGRLLSMPALVGIGLISYSLYLWHWPIFVYANAASVDGLQFNEACLWVLLSFVLAYLSWRFVELPFRQKRLVAGRGSVVVTAAISMLVLAMVGQTIRWKDGVPERLSAQAMRYAQARHWTQGQMACLMRTESPDLNTVCRFGGAADTPPLQLVWGDSHAAALTPALRADAERYGMPVWLASLAGCPPIIGANVRQQCEDFNQQTLALVRREKVHDVVLAGRWSLYLYGEENGDRKYVVFRADNQGSAEQHMADDLRSMVARLRETGARVWLFKEVPMQRLGTIGRLSSLAMIGRSAALVGRPVAEYKAREQFIDGVFAQLSAADAQVRVLDPSALLCAGGICRAEVNGAPLYMDENHLSDQGGERMKPLFEPIFLSENAR